MIKVKFYKNNSIPEKNMKYVVIVAQYKNKWIVVRHKDRSTWEIPGGHIEKNENIYDAAKRELYEETGAKEFILKPINIYSVSFDNKDETFGQLYYAQVKELSDLPESEISETKLVDILPENLTYPLIQPKLFKEVIDTLNNNIF